MVLRELRLDLTIALRTLGFAPWLVSLAFLAIARWQEPTFLRIHDTEIAWHATFVSACVVSLLAALSWAHSNTLSSKRNHGWQVPLASLVVLTLTTCVVMGAATSLFDLLHATRLRPSVLAGTLFAPILRVLPAIALAPGLACRATPLPLLAVTLLATALATHGLLGQASPLSWPTSSNVAICLLGTIGSCCVSAYLCDTRWNQT